MSCFQIYLMACESTFFWVWRICSCQSNVRCHCTCQVITNFIMKTCKIINMWDHMLSRFLPVWEYFLITYKSSRIFLICTFNFFYNFFMFSWIRRILFSMQNMQISSINYCLVNILFLVSAGSSSFFKQNSLFYCIFLNFSCLIFIQDICAVFNSKNVLTCEHSLIISFSVLPC